MEDGLLVQIDGCGNLLRPAQPFDLFEQDFGLGVASAQVSQPLFNPAAYVFSLVLVFCDNGKGF